MTLNDSVHGLRLHVMRRARELGSVSQGCREVGISRGLSYRWRKRYPPYGPAAAPRHAEDGPVPSRRQWSAPGTSPVIKVLGYCSPCSHGPRPQATAKDRGHRPEARLSPIQHAFLLEGFLLVAIQTPMMRANQPWKGGAGSKIKGLIPSFYATAPTEGDEVDIHCIQAPRFSGSGRLRISGARGRAMRESVQIISDYIRARCRQFDIQQGLGL